MQRIHVTIRGLNREDSVLYFPPEAFGPFRVLHQIGAGTLGPVFRAYEPGRDRLVAVKVFRLDVTPEQTDALVAELRTLVASDISHPNIAAPIAAGLEHGAAFLAQEYAVGDSLDVVLRERGPMTMHDVAAMVESLAGAIDYAADRGIHHGLLHPRDVVVAADAVRMTGFGIASALSKVGAKLPTRPQYSLAGAALDIYSLGAIAFEAVTGKRPSEHNLKEFEAAHGAVFGRAFGLPLSSSPEVRPARAGVFAAVLSGAIGATGAKSARFGPAVSTAASAPVAPDPPASPIPAPFDDAVAGALKDWAIDPDAPVEPTAPVAPKAPVGSYAPDALNAPNPPVVPVDPLDRVIELGSPRRFDVDVSDFAADARSAPVSTYEDVDVEPGLSGRRWPIVPIFLALAVLTAVAVGLFLQSRPSPAGGTGVDSTDVDLPSSAPAAPGAFEGKPDATSQRNTSEATNRRNPPNRRNAPVAPDAPVASGVPAPSPSRPASGAVQRVPTGSVLIRSTPSDADVLVNGNPRGKTPLALRDLALGSYTIRVARDGYAPEERTLQLTPQRPTASTTIELREVKTGPGGLNVQSRPAGARVFVNDRLAGSTPIVVSDLPAGPATVRIELDGHEPWVTTVSVVAGEQIRVGASLEER